MLGVRYIKSCASRAQLFAPLFGRRYRARICWKARARGTDERPSILKLCSAHRCVYIRLCVRAKITLRRLEIDCRRRIVYTSIYTRLILNCHALRDADIQRCESDGYIICFLFRRVSFASAALLKSSRRLSPVATT